jgi:hypothetical protein
MNYLKNSLQAVYVTAGLVVLAGCTGMNGGKAATQAAPVPPPPAESGATIQQGTRDTKTQREDLPDRLFSPLDDTVNDINRDINRQIDSEFPANKKQAAPDSNE